MAFADPELWRQRRGWRPLRIRTRRPVLAWIVAIAILGGFALLSITGPSSGKTAANSPAPLPAMVPAPVTIPVSKSSPGTQDPARHRPSPRHTAKTAAGQLSPRQPGTATATATATAPAAARAPRAPRASASPRRSTPAPAVLVRYFVDGVSGGTFQGEVDVVNNGRQPLAGWQIVVALEGDEVTAVQNATGFDSNGILLMQPVTSSEVVPPDGGTLRVFFAARGPRTIPLACAFNSVSCQ